MTGNSEQAVMGQLVQSKYTEMRGLHFILYPPRQSLQCLLYRESHHSIHPEQKCIYALCFQTG